MENFSELVDDKSKYMKKLVIFWSMENGVSKLSGGIM